MTSQWPIVPALFLWTLSQREMMLRVGKRHVRAKFFRISGAVKWLASDVMINWPRATCTARNHGNNGFDHNVAAGYHETSWLNWSRATHDANNGFDHTAQVISTVVFLPQRCWSQFVKYTSVPSFKFHFVIWSRELFGKWRHDLLAKGKAHKATWLHENYLGLMVPCLWWTTMYARVWYWTN